MSYHSDLMFHDLYPDGPEFNDAHDDNDRIPPDDDEYVDNDIFEAHFDMEPPKQK
jgi:hypothetical protein